MVIKGVESKAIQNRLQHKVGAEFVVSTKEASDA
jgi:hypothetical protein